VISAYNGYMQALPLADDSLDPAKARAILESWASAANILSIIKAFQTGWALHEVSYGYTVTHIVSTKVTGGTAATIRDCADTSHAGLKSTLTGLPVPGTAGHRNVSFVTRLIISDGRWVVSFHGPGGSPCTP
jgi:hypothetical protein